jgi:hypothetical protein
VGIVVVVYSAYHKGLRSVYMKASLIEITRSKKEKKEKKKEKFFTTTN